MKTFICALLATMMATTGALAAPPTGPTGPGKLPNGGIFVPPGPGQIGKIDPVLLLQSEVASLHDRLKQAEATIKTLAADNAKLKAAVFDPGNKLDKAAADAAAALAGNGKVAAHTHDYQLPNVAPVQVLVSCFGGGDQAINCQQTQASQIVGFATVKTSGPK